MEFANYICPQLRVMIDHLVNHTIGNIAGNLFDESSVKVCDFTTGRPCIDFCSTKKDVCDRFKLKIPYAGKQIIWEIVFNSLSFEDPPDFNLNDNNFTGVINADNLEKFVPSLINWKFNDPAALTNVVSEFISLYRKYQYNQLKEEESSCCLEYLSIMETNLINENDVEVLITDNGLVHFLIRLCPDLSDYNLPQKTQECYAVHVNACFSMSTGNKVAKPHVKFTSYLKDCLMPKTISINGSDNNTLADYVVKLNEIVEDSMSPKFLKLIGKRKRFIIEWLTCLGRKVIEFDAIEFYKVSFLMDYDGFHFILYISLPKEFTASPPEYRFQSIYLQTPLVIPVDGVPYHQNWTFNTMMVNAINFIESKVLTFKRICIEHM